MTSEQFIVNVESTQEAFRRFLAALCCGDTSLADDIAQEAYIKAYLSCDSLADPAKFKAWIFRIGYTTFLNQCRSARVYSDIEQASGLESGSRADDLFRYQELYAALNQLPAKERMSVLLFYMEGYSVKEIAEIEGAGEDAVKQHLSRGRKHLRNLLTTN